MKNDEENNNLLFRSEIVDLKNKKLYLEELYSSEDGYYGTIIRVESKDFCGASNSCIPKNEIERFLSDIAQMSKTLKESTVLNDYDSDAFLRFEMLKYGSLSVSGQVGGSHQEHFLRFRFDNDQTILEKLKKHFLLLLKHATLENLKI